MFSSTGMPLGDGVGSVALSFKLRSLLHSAVDVAAPARGHDTKKARPPFEGNALWAPPGTGGDARSDLGTRSNQFEFRI